MLAALCLAAGTGCVSLDGGLRGPEPGLSAPVIAPTVNRDSSYLSTVAASLPQTRPNQARGFPIVMDTTLADEITSHNTAAVLLKDIGLNHAPSAQQEIHSLSAIKPVLTPENNSLWEALRVEFKLSNLEGQPERVTHFEKWYAKHPKYFDRLAERAYWFLPYVLAEVKARNIPAEVAILPAVESAFRPDATSRSRAAGMWQFISATGRRFGLRQDWWMDARRDMVQSTRAALDYLEYLSLEFNGDWELALAAYNAGEGTIRKKIRQNKASGLPTDYVHLKLKRETSEYVPRLFAIRNILKDPARFNIALKPLENVQRLRILDLETQTDLTVVSSMLSLSRKQLHFLNLGYTRGVTPPNGPHTIVVPADELDKVVAGLGAISATDRMQWARHKVKKGEVLGKIAHTHGVSVASIRRANSIKGNLIKPGQELRIPLSGGARYAAASPAKSTPQQQPQKKHQVARGDTLWNISRRYKVSLRKLLRWNQLTKRSVLQPGQSIVIN